MICESVKSNKSQSEGLSSVLEMNQNFGCHKFKDDVETDVTRWSVTQNKGLRQEQREKLDSQ
jgi:hypothetical protein